MLDTPAHAVGAELASSPPAQTAEEIPGRVPYAVGWQCPGSGILEIVSDDYIRLIPADKNWQPTPEAAASAEAYVAGLFSGPGNDVWEVTSTFYDQVTLIDAGGLTALITCPLCGTDITEWCFGLLAEYGERIGTKNGAVPCCGKTLPLDTLQYDAPVGFSRFEVCAMNPFRAGQWELGSEELAHVADLLGHPVIQIIART